MVQPPHPWPQPPPENHLQFEPAGLALPIVKGSLDMFFNAALPPKSAAYKIMTAAANDDHQTLRQLLSDPANLPDFVNRHGVSPVMVAAARGNILSLEILAAHPLVNLQRATPDGWTALHYAAHLHQTVAVQSLLKHYADYTKQNRAGEIPFDLATGDAVQDAFWQHKDFARYMKKRQPGHPRFTPKNAAPQSTVAEDTPPPADKLRLDFIASAARMALTGQTAVHNTVMREIVRQLNDITPDDFMACCKTLRDAENEMPQAKKGFDWNNLFIETAKSGRDDLIAPFASFLQLDDRKTLNDALYHCLRVTDAPAAVATLLQLGADPTAKAPVSAAFLAGSKDNIIAFKAFSSRRPESFRQICLWTDKLPHWEKNKEHLQFAMRLWKGRSFQVNDPVKAMQLRSQMIIAIDLHDQRLQYRGLSKRDLLERMDHALSLSGMNTIAALYAESRSPRHMRGIVTFSPDTGARIIAAALVTGDLLLAKRVIADGYSLQHAQLPETRQTIERLKQGTYGDASKTFTQAHCDGTLNLPKIETPADRLRNLVDIAARTPTISGRGFF